MNGQANLWNLFMNPMMFQNHPMNFGGNANWQGSYTGIMNPNQIQNNSFNMNQGNKMSFIFKPTSGAKPVSILMDYGRTVEDLIHTFFMRMDRENLFRDGGVAFLHNATEINYHNKTKIEEFFTKFTTPTILVLDVNNLIGA